MINLQDLGIAFLCISSAFVVIFFLFCYGGIGARIERNRRKKLSKYRSK